MHTTDHYDTGDDMAYLHDYTAPDLNDPHVDGSGIVDDGGPDDDDPDRPGVVLHIDHDDYWPHLHNHPARIVIHYDDVSTVEYVKRSTVIELLAAIDIIDATHGVSLATTEAAWVEYHRLAAALNLD